MGVLEITGQTIAYGETVYLDLPRIQSILAIDVGKPETCKHRTCHCWDCKHSKTGRHCYKHTNACHLKCSG